MPIALSENVCKESVEKFNQLLADTITLRDLYKKHHWRVAGATFYQLHLLFDKHYSEQNELVDAIAERIQVLGGVSVAMAPAWPKRRRSTATEKAARKCLCRSPACCTRTKSSSRKHERWRASRRTAATNGSNDLIVNDVIRRNDCKHGLWLSMS